MNLLGTQGKHLQSETFPKFVLPIGSHLHQCQTVNQLYYMEVLKRLREKIKKKGRIFQAVWDQQKYYCEEENSLST
ncbi:hypothetical protein TNCV_1919761 [Trichonephila clavipes]|nr:hypothetical protein TNCV_1919761 [Trichonephila clavipes]